MTRRCNSRSARIILVLLISSLAATWAGSRLFSDSTGIDRLHDPDVVAAATDAPENAREHSGKRRRLEGSGLYRTAVGSELQYDIRLNLDMTITGDDSKAGKGRDKPLELRSEGRLIVSLLARRPGELMLRYRLPGLSLVVVGDEGGRSRGWGRSIAAGLDGGFDVRLDDRGRILGYRFPESMTSDQHNWARSITSAFAFTLEAAGAGEASWRCTEVDSLGTYVVEYERLGDGSIERRKIALTPHCFDAVGRNTGTEDDVYLDCRAVARFDAEHGWIQRAELQETVRFKMPSVNIVVCQETRGTLKLSQVGTSTVGEVDWEGAWAPVSGHLERSAVIAEQMAEQWQQKLEGRTLGDLLSRLRELIAAETRPSDAYFATLRLLAHMIEMRPGTADEIARLVQTFEVRGRLAESLLTALGMAGGTEAQSALAVVFAETRHEDTLRMAAVQSMFQVAKPGDGLVRTLQHSLHGRPRLNGLDGSTMLVLGAFAARRSDGRALVETLLGHESAAGSGESQLAWFEALGNSGDPRVLDVARRYLRSENEDQRKLALSAIRRVDDPAARALLSHHATTDRSTIVRAHGVELLGEGRDPRVTAVLVDRARSDADVAVRRAAIFGLSARMRTEAGVRQHLEALAGSERNVELLELLRKLIA